MRTEDKSRIFNNLPQVFWNNSQDLVRQTLQVPFIQDLIGGVLSDETFSLCDQQDKYFGHIVRYYRRFIQMQKYNDGYLPGEAIKILNERKASAVSLGIVPTAATNGYIDFIASNVDSLSLAVTSLLPCSKLYHFLTQELLRAQSPRYGYWIERHPPDKSKRSMILLESLMNNEQGENAVQLEAVFRTGLQHEIAFFSQFG